MRVCAQCGTCAEACPQGAINRDDQGVYRVDPHKCEGCLDCVQACPNGVMFVPPGSSCPVKCDLCSGKPRCIASCPKHALTLADTGVEQPTLADKSIEYAEMKEITFTDSGGEEVTVKYVQGGRPR